MFRKLLLGVSKKTAEKEIRSYLSDLDIASQSEKQETYQRAVVIFAQFVERHGDEITDIFFKCNAKELNIESKSEYVKNIDQFVRASNSAVNAMNKRGSFEDAAGMKLLNETLRCMLHPHLYNYGTKVWDHFEGFDSNVEQYLREFKKSNPQINNEILEIAIKYKSIRPDVFKN